MESSHIYIFIYRHILHIYLFTQNTWYLLLSHPLFGFELSTICLNNTIPNCLIHHIVRSISCEEINACLMKLSAACPAHLVASVFMYNPNTSYNHQISSLTSLGQLLLPVIAFNLIVLKYLDNFDCLLPTMTQAAAVRSFPLSTVGRIDYSSILSALAFCV